MICAELLFKVLSAFENISRRIRRLIVLTYSNWPSVVMLDVPWSGPTLLLNVLTLSTEPGPRRQLRRATTTCQCQRWHAPTLAASCNLMRSRPLFAHQKREAREPLARRTHRRTTESWWGSTQHMLRSSALTCWSNKEGLQLNLHKFSHVNKVVGNK